MTISNAYKEVPMMFRAQVSGRSQIHRLIPKQGGDQHAYDWAEEWQEGCDRLHVPQFAPHIQTRACKFTWRMVTNSGQDEGVIRPVIGARGWAYFPGSSMKGAFLRACRKHHPHHVLLFCGGKDQNKELHPGILRFHGGYPRNASWLDNSLVDIVHPQEDWQVKGNRAKHETPKILISLYQPRFVFGISSIKPLKEEQWTIIWEIWQAALEEGIGSRVSAGYGQIATHKGNRLVSFGLMGEGAASKRIDGKGEFRSNVFKAALRGHTRRLFNGITDEATADTVTKLLWGGIGQKEKATVGLLGISFNAPNLELDEWRSPSQTSNIVPIYETGESNLEILLMRSGLSEEQRKELRFFAIRLMTFAMLLGGFGKSWRRADHRIFFSDYKQQMIGCHWEFTSRSNPIYVPFQEDFATITKFLETFHQEAKNLSWFKQIANSGRPSPKVREAWRKGNVQVWGRLAQYEEDCLAIHWLHRPYKHGNSIKGSELTGRVGQIGRIWHRMYPLFEKEKTPNKTTLWTPMNQYAELLTIFPNVKNQAQQKVHNFLQFLDQETDFKRLW